MTGPVPRNTGGPPATGGEAKICAGPGPGERPAGAREARSVLTPSLPAGSVVSLAPIGVAEHLVGLGDLPEAASGVGVPRVGIGMGVVGQAPVRTGDLIVAGARQHLQPDGRARHHCRVVWQSLSELYLADLCRSGYHNTCSPVHNGKGLRASSSSNGTEEGGP